MFGQTVRHRADVTTSRRMSSSWDGRKDVFYDYVTVVVIGGDLLGVQHGVSRDSGIRWDPGGGRSARTSSHRLAGASSERVVAGARAVGFECRLIVVDLVQEDNAGSAGHVADVELAAARLRFAQARASTIISRWKASTCSRFTTNSTVTTYMSRSVVDALIGAQRNICGSKRMICGKNITSASTPISRARNGSTARLICSRFRRATPPAT